MEIHVVMEDCKGKKKGKVWIKKIHFFWFYLFFYQKKEEWLRKPLLVQHSGGFNNVDIKEIQYTLEQGNKTLREVEPYFRQYDTRLVPLIETLNTDIGQFERVYELLV